MSFLSTFVSVNRRIATGIEARFPSLRPEPYLDFLLEEIRFSIEKNQPARVVEAGGVDRPMLRKDDGFEFIGVDIDDRPECANVYDRFIVQTVETPLPIQANMIVSTTLLEHVPDNTAAIQSFFHSLAPGGTTHHYIPSKWHPYSIALRLVGPKLQKILIRRLRPEAEAVTGYPAYFDHCDPASMAALMRSAGFEGVRRKAFYGAADYFAFFLPAYLIVIALENICKALDIQLLASGFVISGNKPS